MDTNTERNGKIIRTSIIGIIANVFLASFKAVIGIMSNSVAIIMDGVNNISDAASSIITIVGTKLAGKKPDKKHPFGYGRIEYLSAMVISILVLYAGVTAFIESVKKIITPDVPEYGTLSLVIVAAAVLVKIILGRYVKGVGQAVNSDSLINAGSDAMLDSVISASTLVAAFIYLIFDISLEAWLGAIIGLVIIKAGLEMLKETLSKILGERVDPELVGAIKTTIRSFPEVNGAYDLVLHNYGPDSYNGSAHIEIPDTLSANDLDRLLRRIQVKVYREHGVILTAIGIYSHNMQDPFAVESREKVAAMVADDPDILQMHGFYIDKEDMMVRFDIVVSFNVKDREALHHRIRDKVLAEFPGYDVQIAMDIDFS